MSNYQGISFSAMQKSVVIIYMIMMSVQIIGIEGMTISPLKAVGLGFSPLIFLFIIQKFEYNFNVLIYTSIYFIALVVCSQLSSSIVVWDRIFYRAMYLIMFICVYQIVNTGEVHIEDFRKLLICILCSYGVIFIVQNICFMAGIHKLLLINLSGAATMAGELKANVLAIEPSHAARILSFVYWGVIVLTEIIEGRELSFKEHFKENPCTTIFFWIMMFFMGSATAMLGAALVGIHFLKKHIALYLTGIIALIILLNVDINIETIDRLKNVINAFLSDDTVATLKATESSGGSRIAPMINTLTNLNLFSWETWIGQGTDNIRTNAAMFTTQRIGDINDFGLISYICSLIFVYKCCIRKFFCVETLLFAILLGFAIGSIYTCWCGMMVCMAIKYYSESAESLMDKEAKNK